MAGKFCLFANDVNEFAIRRLINWNQAAEGYTLPPRQFGEFRVPFVSGLRIIRTQPFFGETQFTLVWNDPNSPNVSHYNVFAYGAFADNQQPVGPTSVQSSPCIFRIPASVNGTRITFVVQTVLTNGQTSILDRSPSVTGVTQISALGSGDYAPNTIPVEALVNGTPNNLITWNGGGAAIATTRAALDLVLGNSNLSTVGALVTVSAAGTVNESTTTESDLVLGGTNLTNVDRLTKVSAAGEITESALEESDPVIGAPALVTAGSVPYVTAAGELTEDANLFFDAANDRLGVGNGAPAATLHGTQATLGSPVQQLSSTAANDDPTEIVVQNRVATTNATVTTIHTLSVPVTTTVGFTGTVVARRTGGASGTAEDGAFYEISGVYKNVAGTATVIGGGPTVTVVGEDQAAWDVTFNPTGATVEIQVTGAANNNVTWHLTLRTYSVSS